MLSIHMNNLSSSLEYEVFNHILQNGVDTPDRTGVGCRKVLGVSVEWSSNTFPISTVRPLGLRFAWEEMKLFLSGNDNTKVLEDQGIKFWVGNTSREFLDRQGLTMIPEGSLGAAYSKQFRKADHWSGGYIDQFKNLYEGLRDNPYSRRHAIDLWAVHDHDLMPILPCWWRSNWSVTPTKKGNKVLHLQLYSRSNDFLLGYWQAAMQYRMLQTVLANLLGYEVGIMITNLWDVHVYHNQFEYVDELLSRKDGTPPSHFYLTRSVDKFEDILDVDYTDFELSNYNPNTRPFNTPKPPMAV